MSALDIAGALASLTDPGALRLLGSYTAGGPCMVGVTTKAAGSTDGFWERHDGGDELLVVLRGRATFTIALPDGATEVTDVGPGQALLIPRGAAHSARVADDVHVFFVTPGDGNSTWRDAGAGARPAPVGDDAALRRGAPR
ncbi:cupin domain-containing protein [Sorangium sp. So ce1099]|uniref:cupin domain-containing protein n=1 Tax=Sorangium sp. So ce1099 TaxID=3133331 RepID=UPI003F628514